MPDPTPPLVTSDAVLLFTINAPEVRGEELTTELEHLFTSEVERTGATNVVLNMGAVTYITSTGVRTLLTLHQQLKKVGGRVVLCGLREMVSEVLAVMRFIDPAGQRPARRRMERLFRPCVPEQGSKLIGRADFVVDGTRLSYNSCVASGAPIRGLACRSPTQSSTSNG